MEVCAICCEDRSRFFSLGCCGHNKICFHCLDNLSVLKCPFCRAPVDGYATPKRPRVLVFSYSVPRTERRQARRALKLEMRELDRNRNRSRSFSI